MTSFHGGSWLDKTTQEDREMADKVQHDDRLRAPYGEPETGPRCMANATQGEWLDRYDWRPGGDNPSPYELLYGCRGRGSELGEEFVLCWLNDFMGGAMTCMVFGDIYLHHSYLEDKLNTNTVNAVALLQFLELMGHAVGHPRPLAVGQ